MDGLFVLPVNSEERQTAINALHVYLEGIEENIDAYAEDLSKREQFEKAEAVCHGLLKRLESLS